MQVQLIKEFVFEAAHSNPAGGEAQRRVHGHSYRAGIGISGPVDPHTGWFVDFGIIKHHFGTLYDQLDHRLLNDVEGLEDVTLPGVAAWILERLAASGLPGLEGVHVDILGDCRYNPSPVPRDDARSWPARVRFGFEAAHRLPNLPDDHKCRRLHGHSFHVDVGVMRTDGLEAHLAELYSRLDHRDLNELPGLENATSEVLSGWLWRDLEANDFRPETVIVQETCTARCVYRGR